MLCTFCENPAVYVIAQSDTYPYKKHLISINAYNDQKGPYTSPKYYCCTHVISESQKILLMAKLSDNVCRGCENLFKEALSKERFIMRNEVLLRSPKMKKVGESISETTMAQYVCQFCTRTFWLQELVEENHKPETCPYCNGVKIAWNKSYRADGLGNILE